MPTIQRLSYAGITLPLAGSFLESSWLKVVHDQYEAVFADYWNFDAPDASNLPTPSLPKLPEFKLDVLSWPTGASSPAWFHTIVETARWNAISTACSPDGYNKPKPLVMFDGRSGKTITASMYIAGAARPLNQLGNEFSDLWLLTLTDVRFYWYFARTQITQPSTWADLFSQIGAALGTTINVDTVNAAYKNPSGKWALPYSSSTPVILDAAAAQIGQKVVVGLDGSVNTVNWRTARTAALGYIANTNGRLISGGLVQENAIVKYVPEAVKTLFLDNSTIPLPGMPKVVVEELGALGIDLYGSATGVPGWKQTIYGDLVFDGKNLADINAYAKQAAIDWYGWRLMSPELVYAGIEPWEPTGWEDCIEWTLKLIEQNPALPDSPTDDPYTKTQIRRGPWTDFNIGNLTAQQIKNPPSDSIYQPDYGSYVDGIQNEICILGIRYVTRGKLTAVGSGQSIRLSWYDLETRPDGCCPCPQPGSGSGNTGPTACCPYGTLASIAAAMQGAFGPNCETVTFGGTLNRTGNGFEGTLFGTGAYTAYTANVIVSCIAGVWRLDAVVILPSGRLVQFGFILGMLPGSGILSGAGNAQQIACANNNLVAAHVLYPCLSGGSGSSGSSGSGTAVVTDCGTLSQNIVIRFGGTLGALGSVNLTYNATNQEWESAPVTLPGCGVTVPTSILFFCGGLNQWNISFGTVFIASSTTTSFTGSTFGTCPGTGTAVVL